MDYEYPWKHLELIGNADLVEDLISVKTFLLLLFFLVAFVKMIKIFSSPQPPTLTYSWDAPNNRIPKLIHNAPILSKVFKPPSLWGRNGHFQTATYGVLGHKSLNRGSDKRQSVLLSDGTTTTFDIIEPTTIHPEGDFTFILCPGIANSSENVYIRTFFHYAQGAGFRVVVLNHLGALRNVPLTSARIFTYGGITEFEVMVEEVLKSFPETRIIVVGFSMGGNIVTKYLGCKGKDVSPRILCGMSICQGYDANKACPTMHEWEGFRRMYLYIMTENMKRLLRRNYQSAVKPHVKCGLVDERKLFAATSLLVLDEEYSRKVAGFDTIEEYYKWCSCSHHLDAISVPMIFVNALDDPIVPPKLLGPPRSIAERKADMLFVTTKHGGHLGFLEGSSFRPNSVTWLDRMIVEVANAAIKVYDPCGKKTAESTSKDVLG